MSMIAMLALSLTTLPLAPHALAPAAPAAYGCTDSSTNRASDCAAPSQRGAGGTAETARVRNPVQARAKPCNSDSLKGLACRHDNMRLNMESKSEALAAR